MSPKKSSKGKFSIPKYRWLMFWLLVLCSVALVCAIFGNVDVRTLRPIADRTETNQYTPKQTCEARRRSLESTVSRLETENKSLRIQLENSTPLRGTSGYYDLDQECYSVTGQPAQPTSYVTYIDEETSVSVNIPYNSKWGTAQCPPVQLAKDGDTNIISFGPTIAGEGGEARDSGIRILPTTSTKAVLQQIKDELSGTEEPDSPIRERLVNGLTVYSYHMNYGLGGSNKWIAVDRNFVYQIGSVMWLTDAEAIKIIQSLKVVK